MSPSQYLFTGRQFRFKKINYQMHLNLIKLGKLFDKTKKQFFLRPKLCNWCQCQLVRYLTSDTVYVNNMSVLPLLIVWSTGIKNNFITTKRK